MKMKGTYIFHIPRAIIKILLSLFYLDLESLGWLSKTSCLSKLVRPHLKCHFLTVSQLSTQRRKFCSRPMPLNGNWPTGNSKLPSLFDFKSCWWTLAIWMVSRCLETKLWLDCELMINLPSAWLVNCAIACPWPHRLLAEGLSYREKTANDAS